MAALNIVLCGQPRSADMIRHAVERYARFRDEGAIHRIVYSTWSGEIDRYPGLRVLLERRGVDTVEAPMPLTFMETPGNYFYQALQLLNGLERVEANEMVLKTRPDATINAALDVERFRTYLDMVCAPTTEGSPLRRRIGVGRVHPIIPFFFEDRYFYGLCADLRQMTKLSRAGDILAHSGNLIAEARWFGGLFTETFPVLRHVMRVLWLVRAHVHTVLPFLNFFEEAIIARCYAVYYYLFEIHFAVGLPPELVDSDCFVDQVQPPPALPGVIDAEAMPVLVAHPVFQQAIAEFRAEGLPAVSRPDLTDEFRLAINALGKRPGWEELVSSSYEASAFKH